MSLYDTLNEQQKKGVFTVDGPVLLLAGAGSGKTRVITSRIAYLIEQQKADPWNIMAITFTNKAAGEMKERVMHMVGEGADRIWVMTFHATCVRILRRYIDRIGYDTNFVIYDTDDQKTLMKEICKRCNVDTKAFKERSVLAAISSAKDSLIGPDEYALRSNGDYYKQRIAQLYREYQEALKKNNAVDFDDLIMLTVELFKSAPEVLLQYQNRFRYIMVDEYQDTNTAQFTLVRLLAQQHHNLCVVGDDDQSIYKFRGANIRNILDFEKHYPEAAVIRLEQNYRSTQNILDAANSVIRNNKGRKEKALWTEQATGSLVHFRQFENAYEEAEFVADDIGRKSRNHIYDFKDSAVLFRTNAQARLLEERLIIEGIPYDVVGGTNFYARREIKDLLCYLKTIDNGRDDLAVRRIINVPRRGIGATTLAKVQDFAEMRDISLFEALCRTDEIAGLGKAEAKLKAFAGMIQVFRSKLTYYGLSDLLKDVIETTGYTESLEAADEEDAAARMENIDELISKVVDFEQSHEEAALSEFLEEVALVADIDRVEERNSKVLLMTLHSAKGLEFKNVYITGMEDGLFPSYMSIAAEGDEEIEEERRLAYVGITRAKENLTLCCAKQRLVRGETQYNAVSRFVREIPEGLLDNRVPGSGGGRYFEEETREYPPGRETPGEYRYKERPVAVLKPKRTAPENKPYIASASAGSGTGGFGALGIRKGMGTQTGGRPDYDAGDRVRHVKYGEGTVLAMEAGPKDYKVTVDFDEAGQKIMYAGFAKLEKL